MQVGGALAQHWSAGVHQYVAKAEAAHASALRVLEECAEDRKDWHAQQEALFTRLESAAAKFGALKQQQAEVSQPKKIEILSVLLCLSISDIFC